MPNTVSVSAAQPNKLVVNGCDLVNRAELSQSQNRELQRYIDANAHLLGLLDKPKDENEAPNANNNKYGSLGRVPTLSADGTLGSLRSGSAGIQSENYGSYHSTQFWNRVNSPTASEYSRIRKGVSWVDNQNKNQSDRARSHSPYAEQNGFLKSFEVPNSAATGVNKSISSGYGSNINPNYNWATVGTVPDDRYSSLSSANTVRPYSPSYSTSDRRRSSYDYDYGTPKSLGRGKSPWEGNASVTSRESRSRDQRVSGGGGDGGRKTDWKGFPIPDIPVYSSLERHPHDYNRFRELRTSRSPERDESMKFYGFGDHKVSGIELKAKRWTGGEIITDPTFIKKSLKPRRVYYSPIGDGCVEADGIEMKYPPKDMTPYLSVRHERYVEDGANGHAGRHVIEEKWSEGSGRNANDASDTRGRSPLPDDDGNRAARARQPPYDGDGGNRAGQAPTPLNTKRAPRDTDYGAGAKKPARDDGSLGRPAPRAGTNLRPASALSAGTDGPPREGWTKTFIVNPRELIHQYGNETQTIIFDLEDHTPKVTTTIRERISQSPAPPRN